MKICIGIYRKGSFVILNPAYLNGSPADVRAFQSGLPKGCTKIFFSNYKAISHILSLVSNLDSQSITINEIDPRHVTLNTNGHYTVDVKEDTIEYIKCGNRIFGNLSEVYRWMHIELDKIKHSAVPISFASLPSAAPWIAGSVYSGPATLLLYALQKVYGYTAVYYYMFKDLIGKIKSQHPDEKINIHILSIGCGCKQDALAFKYVLSDNVGIINSTKYRGIDPGDWGGSDICFYLNADDHEEYYQLTGGINYVSLECDYITSTDYKNEVDSFHSNNDGISVYIVVFPNMLSEIIPFRDVDFILDAIKDTYKDKELYIALSRNPLDTISGTSRIDMDQAHELNDYIINRNGGTMLSHKYFLSASGGTGGFPSAYIQKTGFYPDLIKRVNDFINSTYGSAARYMISTKRYIQYEIYRF